MYKDVIYDISNGKWGTEVYKSRVFVKCNPHDNHKENIYRIYVKGNEKGSKYFIQKEKKQHKS